MFASGSQFQISGSLLVTGSTRITGSVFITGSTQGGGSGHILTYNTSSGQLFFTASSAIAPSSFITYRRLISSSTLDSTDLTNVNTGAPYVIEMNSGSANTLTVPLNSTIGFTIGSQITVSQYGAGQTIISSSVGVTLRSPGSFLKLAAQYSMCTLMKVDTNEWYVVGQLAP